MMEYEIYIYVPEYRKFLRTRERKVIEGYANFERAARRKLGPTTDPKYV